MCSRSSVSHWIKHNCIYTKDLVKPAVHLADLNKNLRNEEKIFQRCITLGQVLHFFKCLCGEAFNVDFVLWRYVAFKRTKPGLY